MSCNCSGGWDRGYMPPNCPCENHFPSKWDEWHDATQSETCSCKKKSRKTTKKKTTRRRPLRRETERRNPPDFPPPRRRPPR